MDKSNKKRKGIALIYDPHNLYQFLWYYCTYGDEYEWTALCLPNGAKGEYMSVYCEKSGIFDEIIRDKDGAFLTMSLRQRLVVFGQMFWYAIRGMQKKYCKRLVGKYINDEEYDIAVVLTDVGIVSGAFIALSDEKRVVILEDGMGDYFERSNRSLLKNLFNPYDWQGFLLAKMGYANPGHRYPLKTTENCEKFCSNPDRMIYKNYKRMKKLFDTSKTDMELYKATTGKIYSKISECDFENAEAIIFTDRLLDFSTNSVDEYVEKFQDYINSKYHSIILKCHPRDDTPYQFAPEVRVQKIDSSIPGEAILPYLGNVDIIFMYTTSIILYMGAYGYKALYIYFNKLYEKTTNEGSHANYITKQEMEKCLERFGIVDGNIIEL